MFKSMFLMAFALLLSVSNAHAFWAEDAGAVAPIIDNKGAEIGSAYFKDAGHGVLIHIKVADLPVGWHGLHLHAVGLCEDDEAFKTAKGHVGIDEGPHGFLSDEKQHPGDLPNLIVGENGKAEVELYTSMVSLSGGEHPLLDDDGSSLMIHEAADDHITQPIGGSGARIACGDIIKR